MGRDGRTPRIVCVLRAGGVYDQTYVHNLYRGVRKHCTLPYEFVCLTDMIIPTPLDMKTIGLETDLPGWWAKMEVFRLDGPCLYFDLDTVIVSSIDKLLEAICRPFRSIYMLRPFKATEMYASGIMGWQGNWRWLFDQLTPDDVANYHWDQRYISTTLMSEGISPFLVQDFLDGICSFKHHCRDVLPQGASVVCFHGHPRPHEVDRSWIQ